MCTKGGGGLKSHSFIICKVDRYSVLVLTAVQWSCEANSANATHLYNILNNVGPTSSTLDQHCTNVLQIFYVNWEMIFQPFERPWWQKSTWDKVREINSLTKSVVSVSDIIYSWLMATTDMYRGKVGNLVTTPKTGSLCGCQERGNLYCCRLPCKAKRQYPFNL